MHGGDRKVGLPHLVSQPVYLPLGVTKYDSLCDCQCVIQVTERVKLPLLSLDSHKELFDALECQLITESLQ